jgi:hypothetical protein
MKTESRVDGSIIKSRYGLRYAFKRHFRKGFTLPQDYGEVLIDLPAERSHFVFVLAREDEDEHSDPPDVVR